MAAGSKLGRYELLARIATGGMGEIFLARLAGAAGFEKLCVIKRILPHLADDDRFRAMLIGEAQVAASMSHANICHVYELDEVDRQLYMVMEYLEGVTLLQLLRSVSRRDDQLDLGFVAGVIQQASEGLHYAHELRDRNGTSLGVVHRDVTPSNLFLTESGVVKVVDFGIAKVKDNAATDSGAVKGKYAYMAPEQLRGQAIDRRVDVWSLAVVVFEMLTCRRLYQRKTDYLTFRAVMEPPQLDFERYRPDAPARLIPVLERALTRDAAGRFPTVRQFAGALIDALGAIRPWSQGDISELVRTTFAEEISLNNAEVSRIVRRSEREPDRAIPVIVRRTPSSSEADPFAVEGEADEPVSLEASLSPVGQSSDLRSGAFGQAISVPQASDVVPAMPPSLPPAPRGRVSPTAVVLGGAALVLVIGLVAIGGRPAPRPSAPASAAAPPPEPSRARLRPTGPYGAAIGEHEQELDQCARVHGDALPADARAVIVIGVDGRARQVALQPDSTERSLLGGCIRGVLQVVKFPAAAAEKQVALGLALTR